MAHGTLCIRQWQMHLLITGKGTCNVCVGPSDPTTPGWREEL